MGRGALGPQRASGGPGLGQRPPERQRRLRQLLQAGRSGPQGRAAFSPTCLREPRKESTPDLQARNAPHPAAFLGTAQGQGGAGGPPGSIRGRAGEAPPTAEQADLRLRLVVRDAPHLPESDQTCGSGWGWGWALGSGGLWVGVCPVALGKGHCPT